MCGLISSVSELDKAAFSLSLAAETFSKIPLTPIVWLEGGDEAMVLKADGPAQSFVIHASSNSRSPEALSWCHRIAKQAHNSVAEAIIPLERDGRTTFQWDKKNVAIFPFIDGDLLNPQNGILRNKAAAMLARIHSALTEWSGEGRPNDPLACEIPTLPSELDDHELDQWWRTQGKRLTSSLVHGDYYGGNILCRGDDIMGVIDWHEANIGPLALELAGAIYEFCQDECQTLHMRDVTEFIETYHVANGPIPAEDYQYLPRLVRVWVRQDVIQSLKAESVKTSTHHKDHDNYIRNQISAFQRLKDWDWII